MNKAIHLICLSSIGVLLSVLGCGTTNLELSDAEVVQIAREFAEKVGAPTGSIAVQRVASRATGSERILATMGGITFFIDKDTRSVALYQNEAADRATRMRSSGVSQPRSREEVTRYAESLARSLVPNRQFELADFKTMESLDGGPRAFGLAFWEVVDGVSNMGHGNALSMELDAISLVPLSIRNSSGWTYEARNVRISESRARELAVRQMQLFGPPNASEPTGVTLRYVVPVAGFGYSGPGPRERKHVRYVYHVRFDRGSVFVSASTGELLGGEVEPQ